MKIKKIIIILVLLLLTGCGDYRELTDMAIVASLGIDKIDDDYVLYTQILNSNQETSTESNNNSSTSVMVYESTGKTIHEAFRNLTLTSPKKMYVGHVEVVVVSEKILEELTQIFDIFLRDTEMEKDFYILMAKDNIKEIMNTTDSLIKIPAESIDSGIKVSSKIQGNVYNVKFDEVVSTELQEGIDPIIPIIEIKKNKSNDEEINPSKRLMLSKQIAIFSNDKLTGYLDKDTTLGYNLINENTTNTVISFKCNKDKYASIELTKNKSNFDYDIKTNTLKFNINIAGSLSETDCNIDINKKKELDELTNKLENHLKDIMKTTINSIKKYNKSDFLGIGRYIYRNNYKYYKKNKNKISSYIKDINEDIKVKVEFTQAGLMKNGDEKY